MLAWLIRALWQRLQTTKGKAGIKSCRQHQTTGERESVRGTGHSNQDAPAKYQLQS